jgi:sulfide:quinone oxidoreductase
MLTFDGAGDRYRVVVAGGGIAGLETVLALRELAGDRVAVTLLAPTTEFVYRPQAVREPFALGPADRYDLCEMADDLGAELVVDRLSWIDPAGRMAHTSAGHALAFDALVVAVGARMLARHPLALTIDPERIDDQLHGLIQDVESGDVRSIAFIVPAGRTWLLPPYELALMTAQRAYDAQTRVQVSVVTSEDEPLGVFGKGASTGVKRLLDDAGIEVVPTASVQMPSAGRITVTTSASPLRADRVVAMPELHGPPVRGLPAGAHSLIPIDPYCRVRGLEDVYAAGDATDYPIKHGGVSAQQGVTAAYGIAARAGAPVMPRTLRPSIRAVLMTGAKPRYLSARVAGDSGILSEISETPGWSPPDKIVADHLAPYLAEHGRKVRASKGQQR